tara:strand:- start:666 stop:818 length:153 start_codon:yes stop_codon:yes gene_type:complete
LLFWNLKKNYIGKIQEKGKIKQLENAENNTKPIKEFVFLLVKEDIFVVER